MTDKSPGEIVCCAIGGEQFAFRGADVRLVARAEQMRDTASGSLGELHHGGAAVPVYSLAALLGMPSRHSRDANHIVVTTGAAGLYGVLVDHTARAAAADRIDVLPLPEFAGANANRWFAGMLQAGDLFCPLISPSGIEPGDAPGARNAASTPRRGRGTTAHASAADLMIAFRTAALPPCAADRFAIAARQVAAVVQTLASIPLPGAASFVTGVSSWHGTAAPLLDFSGGGAQHARYLLLRTRGGHCAALPVEADVTLRHATSDHRQLRGGGAPFVTGVFAAGEDRIALIDVDALVGTGEHELIATCAG